MLIGLGLGLTNIRRPGSGAGRLLASETNGLALSASDQSMVIKDTTTPANNYNSSGILSGGALVGPGGKFTYASPSPKLCRQSDGTYKYGAHNLYLNSAAPANQSVTVQSGASYTMTVTGTVSITLSGATTGTITSAAPVVFTAATTTLTCGSTSGSGTVHLRLTNSVTDYVSNGGTALYAPPWDWDTSGACALLCEPQATNLFLQNRDMTDATQRPSSNITHAKNATGIDGVANSASSLTTTASLGYSSRYATTSNGTVYTASVFMRRKSGSGPVYFAEAGYSTIGTGSETTTGSNLVTNGTFTTDLTGWTQVGNDGSNLFSVSGAALQLVCASAPSGLRLSQSLTVTPGKTYLVTLTMTINSGAVNLIAGSGGGGASFNSSGTKYALLTANATSFPLTIYPQTGSTCNVTIDNVTCYEVTSINNAVTLTSDWQIVTRTFTAGTATRPAVIMATSGDVVEVDCFQLETGTVATSPIITYGATVTRAADALSELLSTMPSLGSAYTLAIKYRPQSASVETRSLRIDDGTANEITALGNTSGGAGAVWVVDGGANQTAPLTDGTISAAASNRVNVSVEANNIRMSVNGSAVVSDTSATLPSPTTLRLVPVAGARIESLLVLPHATSDDTTLRGFLAA